MSQQRFPFVAIPESDTVNGPDGAQRVRSFIKQLGRMFRIRIEWQDADSVKRFASEQTPKETGK